MVTSVKKLPLLKPVKFPVISGSGKAVYIIKGTKGQSTKKVVAEIKRLSKKDIYEIRAD